MDALLTPWLIWFVLGIVLGLLEMAVPAFVIFFFGIGCLVVSAVVAIWPLSVTQQVLLFVVSTVASLVFLRRWLVSIFRGNSAGNSANGFDDFPAGAQVRVARRIAPGDNGRIMFRGTLWDAAADEVIEEGEMAEIVRYANHSRQVYHVRRAGESQPLPIDGAED